MGPVEGLRRLRMWDARASWEIQEGGLLILHLSFLSHMVQSGGECYGVMV